MAVIVLVVDDNLLQRNILGEILSCAGYEAHVASSGAEALAVAKAVLPDVVLTDLCMDGMNGIDLMKKLRSLENAPEVIIMSAFGGLLKEMQRTGKAAFRFLEKPLNKDDVLRTIRKVLIDRTVLGED